jgi:outer membrane protein OmpA-like peptidoglycan-associated protein
MNKTLVIATGLVSLLGTGCATKKYVTKTVAPVEARVTASEQKNTDQDKLIADHRGEIDNLGTELSKTKEKLTDVDGKATRATELANQAGAAAKAADDKASGADQKAGTAQSAANGARTAADGARTFAEQGITRLEAANNFKVMKTESVLFGFDSAAIAADAKAQLDTFGGSAKEVNRYVIEVEGFTDQTGPAGYNEALSERRAQAVARYLANKHSIPVKNISVLGVGSERPALDANTTEARKMNRRVEIRLWVPEGDNAKAASAGTVVTSQNTVR